MRAAKGGERVSAKRSQHIGSASRLERKECQCPCSRRFLAFSFQKK